jgi:cytochrome b561
MPDVSAHPYPRQIRILHWLILGLVIVQWITASWMEEFFRRAKDLELGTLPDTLGASLHALFGASILLLMLARLILRFKLGTPRPPSDAPRALQNLALANHLAFYLVLVLLPLTGVASLFFARDFAAAHVTLKTLLLVLIGLHVAGVLYHMLWLKDGLLWRMLRIGRSG